MSQFTPRKGDAVDTTEKITISVTELLKEAKRELWITTHTNELLALGKKLNEPGLLPTIVDKGVLEQEKLLKQMFLETDNQ